ncbi:MAG: esterase, partial [Chloroflexota bacterium]
KMSSWVEQRCPGTCFALQVIYTSVAGRWLQGDFNGSRRARFAYRSYHAMCGEGDSWGDGLIPVPSALLASSRQVVLEGVSHYSAIGNPWYGSAEVVSQWWRAGSEVGPGESSIAPRSTNGV